ncbi:MAG: ATP-grasp domain-containing protein [Actinobacteria bacterium]|jgi:predicted ATP-grasp superfamily ATP-dependent carboligase|nr:MAG: ATP-grasp domain-containing protein [Actinomycetota bacterium]
MNVLITSSRMPFALDEIRKFGEEGHRVYATDTFHTAPGSHSAAVSEYMITASPRYRTAEFIADLKEIIREKEIDLLVPQFEELFYIARYLDEFRGLTEVFLSPFETLVRFHNKAAFIRLCNNLSIRIPPTTIVTDEGALENAIGEYEHYFARASFSRGGVELLTNTGPLANAVKIEDCHPTPQNPWLVQEFVHGTDLCSFSVAHHGRVAVHCTYEHPKTLEHAGGIQFISVDEPQTLAIVERFVEATGFQGQISFDFLKDEDGLCMVECNPRPTDGVALMSARMFVGGMMERDPGDPRVLEAGHEEQIDVAIVRDMIRDWKEIPSDIQALVSLPDLYFRWHDMVPALYQFLSYSHILAYRHFLHTGRHKRTDIMAAQFYDICWDGEPMQSDDGDQDGDT